MLQHVTKMPDARCDYIGDAVLETIVFVLGCIVNENQSLGFAFN